MVSFNRALDELLTTIDYSTSNNEEFNFTKEYGIRSVLFDLKSHIIILKTLTKYESSRMETDILNDMVSQLSKPDKNIGMTMNNHIYNFLALVSDFICYSKFNSKYHGDKPEEIPVALDNLTDYIDDLLSKSKQRILDNCIDEKDRIHKERWMNGLENARNMRDDRVI